MRDIFQAESDLKKGKVYPFYLLYGTESYLMDTFIQKLKATVLSEEALDFNYEAFNMLETPVTTALEAAETYPFMVDKRMVIMNEALFFTGAKAKYKDEHNLDALQAYLSNPTDYSIVVFTATQEKLDERKKIVKLLADLGCVVQCSGLEAASLHHWITETTHTLGVSIEDEAIFLLSEFGGKNLQLMRMELEKFAHAVGRAGRITQEIVYSLGTQSIEQDVFRLVDHVVHYRTAESLTALRDLIKQNEEPVKILFLIARQIRIMLRARELDRQGYSQGKIASQLKLHPYAVKLAIQQSRGFSDQQLFHALDQLAEADYSMKTSSGDKLIILETFIIQLHEVKQPRHA